MFRRRKDRMAQFECGSGSHPSEGVSQGEGRDAVRQLIHTKLPTRFKDLDSVADTFQPTVPAKYQSKEKFERVGLLTLPRELRDQIYGYLLCVDRFETLKYIKDRSSRLELSILCVNKQAYREASEVLYERNPWICITTEPGLLERLRDARVGFKDRFPRDEPVPMASNARAAAAAAATITLQRCHQSRSGRNRVTLLVSLFAIPRLCRILTTDCKTGELDIRMYLNTLNSGKVREAWHESLLFCFREARGFGYAAISDAQGNKSHAELATLMRSPFEDFQEIVDRASTYHDRALEKQKLGRLSEARCDYHDGHDFIFWFLYSGPRLKSPTDIKNKFDLDELFFQLSTGISFSCAFICIKLGDLDWPLRLIYWTLERLDGYQLSVAQAEAWFLYGLRDLAIGAGNGAAYCFLQTLRNQPGHHGADEAVDKMEAELQSCTGLTERIILHNIQHVLQNFRHQAHDSAGMSDDEYDVLVKEWYTGKKDVGSVGFLHSRDGSVNLKDSNRYMYLL